MRKLLFAALAVLAIGAFATTPAAFADPAEGKGVGHGTKGDKGHSADAPGQTGDTGKDSAPGQNK